MKALKLNYKVKTVTLVILCLVLPVAVLAAQVGAPNTPTPTSVAATTGEAAAIAETAAKAAQTAAEAARAAEAAEAAGAANTAQNVTVGVDVIDVPVTRGEPEVHIHVLNGSSDHGKVTMFGTVHVGPDEVADGDVVIFGGTGNVEGRVEGSVVVFGGAAEISGHVEQDLVMFGGTVHLASTARIDGSLVTIGGVVNREPGAVVMDDTAVIGGQSFGLDAGDLHPDFSFIERGLEITILLTWLVLSFIITLIFSRPVENTAHTVYKKPFQSLLAGFFFHVVTLMICLLLTIIIVGIPLAFLGGFLWIVICVFGTTAGFVLMGKLILERVGKGQVNVIYMLLLGFGVMALVRLLPLFIGWTLWQLWGMAGIGATVMSRFGSNRPWFGNGRKRLPEPVDPGPDMHEMPVPPVAPLEPVAPVAPVEPVAPVAPEPPAYPTPPEHTTPPVPHAPDEPLEPEKPDGSKYPEDR